MVDKSENGSKDRTQEKITFLSHRLMSLYAVTIQLNTSIDTENWLAKNIYLNQVD